MRVLETPVIVRSLTSSILNERNTKYISKSQEVPYYYFGKKYTSSKHFQNYASASVTSPNSSTSNRSEKTTRKLKLVLEKDLINNFWRPKAEQRIQKFNSMLEVKQ